MQPFVSVIVPVRNEEQHLDATLQPLLSQEYPPDRYEILVVDGQSEDNTLGVVRRWLGEFPQLKLHDNPHRISSSARNIGMQNSRGDYIVIVDGHCELRSRTYLADLVAAFERTEADCLGRPQPLETSWATPIQRVIALARASRLGHNPGSHIYSNRGGYVKPQSVAIAYRRRVFERIGMFDEQFDACEDVEFNHRLDAAGFKCYFAPELMIHYRPRDTLTGLAWQMQRYGRGRARLLLKHPETLSGPPLLPALFVVGLVASFALGLFTQFFAAVFCLVALIYSAAVAATGLWLAGRGRLAELAPLFPAVFLAIHIGAGWGVLAELTSTLKRRMIQRILPFARIIRPA
jgi:succinoglycan biosynthesis protein ExoA